MNMNKFPFTKTQCQELEHQALIFKYMASGIPVPPDLLFSLKRSYLDPNTTSKHVGWDCFQMGLGRKIDPEPGRCRRTDGKKWRCSKEAFHDSKYCERHMHRGKNRSRKPVEALKNGGHGGSVTVLTNSLTPLLAKTSISLSLDRTQNRHNLYCNNGDVDQNTSFVRHQYHARLDRLTGLSSQDGDSNATSLLFDSDLRYVYGLKEEVDGHAFFSEEPSMASRGLFSRASSMEDSWQLTPLAISCSSSSSSSSKLQSADHSHKRHDKEDHDQKTIHFFDEWPMKHKDSWLDLDDKSSNITTGGSGSTTELSISVPKDSHDFPIFSSRLGD